MKTIEPELSIADTGRFATRALANFDREYPAKLDHVLTSAADLASPRTLHPAFFGSFDWHSCAHAHWMRVRCSSFTPRCPKRHRFARR